MKIYFLALGASECWDARNYHLTPLPRKHGSLQYGEPPCTGHGRPSTWSVSVYSGPAVDAEGKRVARITENEKKDREHLRFWIAVEEQRGGARSIFDVHTTKALRCKEKNYTEWVLGVHAAAKKQEVLLFVDTLGG